MPTPPWWTSARAPSTSSRRTARWSRPAPATCSPRPWPRLLTLPRAAADWVKRGPCLRVTGSQQFEAEDGSHGFLDRPAAAAALGMLAAPGPAGLLPFDRRHSPAEWRAIRLRLKEAVFAANLLRALRALATRGRAPRC